MPTIKADFELAGIPKRRGTIEATLTPEGQVTGIELLNLEGSSTEEERAEILANVSSLLTQIGPDVAAQVSSKATDDVPVE